MDYDSTPVGWIEIILPWVMALRDLHERRTSWEMMIVWRADSGLLGLFVCIEHPWVLWGMGGWGLGILMHASRIFGLGWLLGPEWERKEVEKKLGRPL